MNKGWRIAARFTGLCLIVASATSQLQAQVVPGTGTKISNVGDNFEDKNWNYIHNDPKSSKEQDEQVRFPTGYAANRLWFEGQKRGAPDVIQIVPTPEGGIPGSQYSLLLASKRTGIPGQISYKMQQDDFVMACMSRVGAIHVNRTPSAVTRVWMPPFDEWENRSGSQFGFRIDLKTTTSEIETERYGFLRRKTRTKTVSKTEPYWPGFFVQFHSETDARFQRDSAVLVIRGDHLGHEVKGPEISPGWWTLGMSVTADGRVHYYARRGVQDLTAQDYLYSSKPYGFTAERFATMFYNVVNKDDGYTWSTRWIVDDPAVYTLR